MLANEICIKTGIQELGIFEKSDDAWVSTREIAKLFEKEHKDILYAIREQILPNVSDDFTERNFPLSKYKDSTGRSLPQYLLNRKSFAMVVMGFTGKRAMQFKERYIEAFENMTTLIETRQLSKAGYKEMSSAVAKYIGKDKDNFAKEATLINEIILGMRASDFRALHNITNGQTRDAVAQSKLNQLDKAQRLNAQLITAGMSYDQRKDIIAKNYGNRLSA